MANKIQIPVWVAWWSIVGDDETTSSQGRVEVCDTKEEASRELDRIDADWSQDGQLLSGIEERKIYVKTVQCALCGKDATVGPREYSFAGKPYHRACYYGEPKGGSL